MIGTYLLKLALLLPLVCGLLVACLWAWRKLEQKLPGNQGTRMIAVKESMMISPGLRLGRVPTTNEWQKAGRPRLVGLSAELQLPAKAAASGRARCAPLLDLVVPSATQLRRAVLLVDAQRRAGGGHDAVWVCCALGFSRSAAAVVGWLHLHGGATDATAAEALVRGVRPQIVLKPAWRALLGSPAAASAPALSSALGNEKEQGTA